MYLPVSGRFFNRSDADPGDSRRASAQGGALDNNELDHQ
jgi:hypothetical protein